ncbi:unnamed protein product [Closterium sp. NIES-53]
MPGVTEPGGTEPGGAGSTRVASRGASSRREVLSPRELREWFARRWGHAAGAGGTTAPTCPGGAGAAGPGGPAEAAGVGPTGGSAGASGGTGATGPAGPGAAGANGVGVAGGVGAGGAADAGTSEGAGAGAPAGSPGALPAGSCGTPRPRPYFVPLLEQVLGLPPSPGPAPSFACPQPVQSQSLLQPVSPLPAPSPYTGPTGGLAERRALVSRPASPARPSCTSRRTSRPRPPAVPGTHQMALRPSTASLRVPLPSPSASSLPAFSDPESDSLRAASPTVARFLATVFTDPSLASTAASALVAELVDFAASCRLDYAASLVAESASVCPPSIGGECALSTDVLEDRQEEFQCFAAALPHLVSTLLAPEGDPDAPDIPTPRSYAEAIEGPYSSQWQAAMDAEMASWKSTCTYVDEVPPSGANIVSGMWIFRVKRPPGSPPVFKARYVARGFSDSPHPWELAEAQRTITLTQSHMVQQVLQRFNFTYSSPQATPLSTRHSLSALPSDESVEPSGPYPELVGCLMYLMTCTRPDLAYPLSILARYVAPGRHRPEHMAAAKRLLRYLCSTSGMGLVLGGRRPVVLTGHAGASWADDQATQRSSQGYTFSLGSGSVSWRSTRSSSVLSSSCEAEIYAGAMAAQELRWLTYLLTDLGEQPHSPPVLYVDNKAMLALCREHRLEHRTKHIALRYFLARELQQRGQLRLAYVASEANTADIFTKALAPGDHQRFCTLLACFALLDWSYRKVAAVEAAAEAAVVAEAAEAVEAAGVAVELVAGLRRGVVSVVVRATSSSAVVRPCSLSSSFPEASEIPRWGELSRAGVAIYDLDFDAILSAMYAVSISDEGDCYRCFPPDSGIENAALGTGEAAALGASDAAALGASASASSGTGESALSGTASASASLTFTLDSGASRSFFWDRTTLTPLSRPVAVSLADPSGGPVLSHFSTFLPCPAAPSGTLSDLYLPSFSTNLVSGADLQDGGVHQFTPACQRVTHYTKASTGRHLATFTRQPGLSLYTLTTPSPPVAESGRTLLWHHRLGHPSLLRLRGMASRLLVSGLPRSLPPLPQGPGPTCVPCVEGRQRAAPHSSQFPPTVALLQTLNMDVWGPARVRGQGHERYFLLVVDDYSRYTSVFPLRSKGDVTEVLIDWIRAARLQLRQSFGLDFPVLRLHSDRGGEFSSGLLGAYCRARGIRQTFTLPDSPQQNGIAECRIGMVMGVARTSMMHAAAPHFLWPFAVRYAAHQINLHPRVSRPETSPALLWTGKVSDASAFRVWGSRAFVRDLSADKLSPRAAPCVFLGFPPDAPGWQFYHPTSRRVLSSQDVTFDESVPYYRLFPYRTPSLPQSPLGVLLRSSSCSPVEQASVQRLFAGSRGLGLAAA